MPKNKNKKQTRGGGSDRPSVPPIVGLTITHAKKKVKTKSSDAASPTKPCGNTNKKLKAAEERKPELAMNNPEVAQQNVDVVNIAELSIQSIKVLNETDGETIAESWTDIVTTEIADQGKTGTVVNEFENIADASAFGNREQGKSNGRGHDSQQNKQSEVKTGGSFSSAPWTRNNQQNSHEEGSKNRPPPNQDYKNKNYSGVQGIYRDSGNQDETRGRQTKDQQLCDDRANRDSAEVQNASDKHLENKKGRGDQAQNKQKGGPKKESSYQGMSDSYRSESSRNNEWEIQNRNRGKEREFQERREYCKPGSSSNQDPSRRKEFENQESSRNNVPRSGERGRNEYSSRSNERQDGGWNAGTHYNHSSDNYQNRGKNPNIYYQAGSYEKKDKGFADFCTYLKSYNSYEYNRVQEVEGDLFAMPKDYSLAHCVAEDMAMGSGIAVQFSRDFKRRDELLQQRQKQGGLAILQVDQRYIYYLVTKKYSSGKPIMYMLWCSLQKMKSHIRDNMVTKLAMPRIGCGLDRLEWSEVKPMIEYTFQDVEIDIIICNFQQPEDGSFVAPVKRFSCKVVNETYPLFEIAEYTAIVYFGSEDGIVTEEIQSLDNKFRILNDYKSARKTVGEVIQSTRLGHTYLLYGFIVKKVHGDVFDFIAFQKCINSFKKMNVNKNATNYVGIQAFLDEDDLIMNKIVNMLRYSLRDVDIYVCWPGKMESLMPPSRDNY